MNDIHENNMDAEPLAMKIPAPDPPAPKVTPQQQEPQDAESDEYDNDEVTPITSENKDTETLTEGTAESVGEEKNTENPTPIVSSSKKSRPPYKYDPHKVTLRFLFANRDGLTVTIECDPKDTVGEVKAALLSVWPEGKNIAVSLYCFFPQHFLNIGFTKVYQIATVANRFD
jgi:hypothetical protein